jgi:hypothetical protein
VRHSLTDDLLGSNIPSTVVFVPRDLVASC